MNFKIKNIFSNIYIYNGTIIFHLIVLNIFKNYSEFQKVNLYAYSNNILNFDYKNYDLNLILYYYKIYFKNKFWILNVGVIL